VKVSRYLLVFGDPNGWIDDVPFHVGPRVKHGMLAAAGVTPAKPAIGVLARARIMPLQRYQIPQRASQDRQIELYCFQQRLKKSKTL
jgi:hypothetical protein